MIDKNQIVKQLTELNESDWSDVLEQACEVRQKKQPPHGAEVPWPGIKRDEFAEWLARQHMAVDPAITEVIYLPNNAPEQEVRLLEVNAKLTVPDPENIEPLDFSLPGLDFVIFVADITPGQWQAIKRAENIALPPNWEMKNQHIWGRK